MAIRRFTRGSLCSYLLGSIFFIANIKLAGAVSPPKTIRSGHLIVATYFTNPPFEYLKNGREVGFEVDLIKEVAKRLNLTIEFKNTQWETIIANLKKNKYDLIMGAITITPNRKKIIAFSEPYMTTTLSIIINKEKTPQINSLTDLHESIVGVQAATTDYDIAVKMQKEQEIKGIKIYSFKDFSTAINDLRAGKVGVVMKVFPVAFYYVEHYPELKILAPVPNDPQPLGFGFNPSNKELMKAVSTIQADMQKDGSYNTIYQRWFGR
ncbi:ABC transporter substrate-binding protein [Legionella fallonii]|uniref:Putative Glutamine ABC transporter, periplasmic glutamine-binding protein n=1 Tax=Legionella fallonii LLAP-10 TaxID=1212491 RepID=A0A098G9B2_9GAMM|nr:ABC transporter substrate-binding protein [Legionella fallonii]CEG58551.1 putative Glutamine ABC transporter, periplasmic glutamine-binding protein [Legionella fallonii LLAP-10]